jgi:hypothetical protein
MPIIDQRVHEGSAVHEPSLREQGALGKRPLIEPTFPLNQFSSNPNDQSSEQCSPNSVCSFERFDTACQNEVYFTASVGVKPTFKPMTICQSIYKNRSRQPYLRHC